VRIYVESHAGMREYTAHLGPEGELEVPDGATVKDVLVLLQVPQDKPSVHLVDGRSRPYDYALHPGDKMVFFPPLEGG
jgi:molybdopterin converting factor small subunit